MPKNERALSQRKFSLVFIAITALFSSGWFFLELIDPPPIWPDAPTVAPQGIDIEVSARHVVDAPTSRDIVDEAPDVLARIASAAKELTPPRSKMSRDLLVLLDSNEQGPFRVIVQARSKDGGDKDAVLEQVRSWAKERGSSKSSSLSYIGATVVELDADSVFALGNRDEVTRISLDARIQGSIDLSNAATGLDQAHFDPLTGQEFDGKDVTIAVLDSGVERKHDDFQFAYGLNSSEQANLSSNTDTMEKAIGDKMNEDASLTTRNVKRDDRLLSIDFVRSGKKANGDDKYGHGSHVIGSIAGNGYETQQFGDSDPLVGAAPRAMVLNIRVLDDWGKGYTSSVLEAIDLLIKIKDLVNLRVMNLSFGHPVFESYTIDPLTLACAAAVDAGISVVCAAGNNGQSDFGTVYGGINSPANAPWVVTVGATNTMGTAARSDDEVANFSSRGPTVIDGLAKPDLVAPGVDIVSCGGVSTYLGTQYPELWVYKYNDDQDYIRLSGTSMSAPMVSGTLALMFQANPSLDPGMAKFILMYTAEKMDGPSILDQGCGSLNAEGAVRMAASMRQDLDTLVEGDNLFPSGVTLDSYSTIAQETILFGSAILYRGGTLGSDSILADATATWGDGFVWSENILYRPPGSELLDPLAILYRPGVTETITRLADVSASSASDGIVETNNLIYRPPYQSVWGDSLLDPTSLNATSEDVLTQGILYPPGTMTTVDSNSIYYPTE